MHLGGNDDDVELKTWSKYSFLAEACDIDMGFLLVVINLPAIVSTCLWIS